MKRRVSRGFCFVLCGGLPPIGACGLLSGTDTAGDRLESSPSQDCDEISASLDGMDWSLSSSDPIASSPSGSDNMGVRVSGRGEEVYYVELPPVGGSTGVICLIESPDATIRFDGSALTINARFPEPTGGCELQFEGTVTECRFPPTDEAEVPTLDDSRVLRIDGEGTYQYPPVSAALSTLFLRLVPHREPPCELPASLVDVAWQLSNVPPALNGDAPAYDQVHTILGAGEGVHTMYVQNPVDFTILGECPPSLPMTVSIVGEQFSLEVGSQGGTDGSCHFRFTGIETHCESLPAAQPAYLFQIIRLDGDGEFDYGSVAGALDTLFLTISRLSSTE